MSYEDLITTKQNYEGAMHRVIYFLNGTPEAERPALIAEAMKEIDEQYITPGTANFTTPSTQKWYKKLAADWEKKGSTETTQDVDAADLGEISFNAEMESIPKSFYSEGKKVLIVGPFWTSSIDMLF